MVQQSPLSQYNKAFRVTFTREVSYIEIREGTWKDRHLYDYQYINVLYIKN